MSFRTTLALVSTLALLALAGCSDKETTDDSGTAAVTTEATQVLPA